MRPKYNDCMEQIWHGSGGEVVYAGRRIDLRIVDVPTHDGGTSRKELVVHPGAAVILPLTESGDVVMIRNVRFAVGLELWELPAGTLEPPESPVECAARELQEETGYRAERFEPLGRFYSSPGFCTEQLHAYVATGLIHVGQDLDATEQIQVNPVPLSRVLQMMLSGEIADAKSIATLGLYLIGKDRT